MEWPELEESESHGETEAPAEGDQAQSIGEETMIPQSIEMEESSEESEGGEAEMPE